MVQTDTVQEGDIIILVCISAVPSLVLRLNGSDFSDTTRLSTFVDSTSNFTEFVIRPVTANDAGEYQCGTADVQSNTVTIRVVDTVDPTGMKSAKVKS